MKYTFIIRTDGNNSFMDTYEGDTVDEAFDALLAATGNKGSLDCGDIFIEVYAVIEGEHLDSRHKLTPRPGLDLEV